jgi:serine/threonine protein kinase
MEFVRATSDVQFTFGRYETIFRIGAGGMAEVFAARLRGEAGFERLVAIKRLLPHLAEDPQHVERFLDEGRLAARVVHPHVVQTLDLGRSDEGEPFLVLELIVGTSLEQLIRGRGDLPSVAVALAWLAQSAHGLHAAHIARAPDGAPLGLVHRDVSPHNILVGLDGDARITDFGIAQAAQLKMARTPTGQVTGKFAYFSPEQATGQALDARSDVFALGIVAWEALTGQRLFHADSPAQIFDRVRSLEVPPPHKLRNDLPARASQVVLAALQRDRAERTPDAHTFARALTEVIDELGDAPSQAQRSRCVRANPDGMWQRLGSNLEFAATQAAPTRSRRWPRGRSGMLLALAALLGGGLYLVPKLALMSTALPVEDAQTDLSVAPASSRPLEPVLAPAPRQRPSALAVEARGSAREQNAEDPARAGAPGAMEPAPGGEPVPTESESPAPPTRVRGAAAEARASVRSERRRRRVEAAGPSLSSAPEQTQPVTATPRASSLLGADAFERNLGKSTTTHDWGGRK